MCLGKSRSQIGSDAACPEDHAKGSTGGRDDKDDGGGLDGFGGPLAEYICVSPDKRCGNEDADEQSDVGVAEEYEDRLDGSRAKGVAGECCNRVQCDEYQWQDLSLIHISEPTRLGMISYAVFCLKK